MKLTLYTASLLTLITTPLMAFAQETRLTFIERLPFMSGAVNSTEDYISALYMISISVAAILVVIRLIMAGVKYMLSEVVTDKGKVKEDIKGALLGLLVILGAVTILNTINPQLTNTDIFRNAQRTTPASQNTGGGNSPVQQNTSTCPQGTVHMWCETATSGYGRCTTVGNTSWCSGQVTVP